jgi:ubiquinone/menaquinone biosynthesis C-methylase UbiE
MVHQKPHYVEDYQAMVTRLFEEYPSEEAASLAVGGGYDAVGELVIALLQHLGVDMASDLIDVGCGSGRVATKLAPNGFTGTYLGTDVVPQLLDFARERCPNEFRFELVESLTIPADNCSADTVMVFSVFTHLRHEESYLYLREMHRVLRPLGRVILSFVEFAEPCHWSTFIETVNQTELRTQPHLNTFIERNVIQVWAEHLGFALERFICGHEPCVPTQNGKLSFWQSVAVLRKIP